MIYAFIAIFILSNTSNIFGSLNDRDKNRIYIESLNNSDKDRMYDDYKKVVSNIGPKYLRCAFDDNNSCEEGRKALEAYHQNINKISPLTPTARMELKQDIIKAEQMMRPKDPQALPCANATANLVLAILDNTNSNDLVQLSRNLIIQCNIENLQSTSKSEEK